MVFNCLGEGNKIEKNKQRIKWVSEVANQDSDNLKILFGDLIDNLSIGFVEECERLIGEIFYEKITSKQLNDVIELISNANDEEIQKIKDNSLACFLGRVTCGFSICIHSISKCVLKYK